MSATTNRRINYYIILSDIGLFHINDNFPLSCSYNRVKCMYTVSWECVCYLSTLSDIGADLNIAIMSWGQFLQHFLPVIGLSVRLLECCKLLMRCLRQTRRNEQTSATDLPHNKFSTRITLVNKGEEKKKVPCTRTPVLQGVLKISIQLTLFSKNVQNFLYTIAISL